MSPIIIGIIGTLILLVPVVLALWFRLRELERAVFKTEIIDYAVIGPVPVHKSRIEALEKAVKK